LTVFRESREMLVLLRKVNALCAMHEGERDPVLESEVAHGVPALLYRLKDVP